MMDGCVSVVTGQNTTSNEKERVREGGKQSSHQHKSSSSRSNTQNWSKKHINTYTE